MASRQRNWQLRKMQNRLCVICGKPASESNKTYCSVHREAAKKRALEYYYKSKRQA